jgi:NAD(P)-dependent dehydrogenase (short-subunit alcohol dehydrogenase family)
MDFSIRVRTAIVCAASRGLGRAIAIALATDVEAPRSQLQAAPFDLNGEASTTARTK